MTTDTNSTAIPVGARRLLSIAAVCAFLVGLDSLVVAPLIPNITGSVGVAADLGGLLVTAYALLYGLSAPLFGPVSDRWGRKNVIVAGLLVFAVGTALTGVASSFAQLVSFRALSGLGGAMLMPSLFALIGDTFPYERRGGAIGVVMGAMIGSTVLGVPLGSFVAYLGSWRWTFYTVALLTLVALLAVAGTLRGAPPRRELPVGPFTAYFGQFRVAFTNPSVLPALLATLLWTAGLQGMFAYIGVYYERNFGLNAGQIGLVILAAGLASVVGLVFGGRLSDRVGKRVVVAFAAVVAAAGVLGFSVLTGFFVPAILAQVIWSASIGFGQSSLTALVSELSPQARGMVLALNSSALYGGMMTATALAAFILVWGGGFLQIGILCAIASLLVLPIVVFLVRE